MTFGGLQRWRAAACGLALAALSCGGVTKISEGDVGAGGSRSAGNGGKSSAGGGGKPGAGGMVLEGARTDCALFPPVPCANTPGCTPVQARVVDTARQCFTGAVLFCVPTTCKSKGPVALIASDGSCVAFGSNCLPPNFRFASPTNGPIGCGVVDVPCPSMSPPEPDPPCAAVAFRFAFEPVDGGAGCAGKLPVPPEGESFDPRHMNVSYRDGMTSQPLVNVMSEAACGTELGYYYDNESNPTEIIGCPRTCEAARTPSGYVSFSLEIGCPVKTPAP